MQESKKNNSFKNIIVVQPLGFGGHVASEPISRYLKKQHHNSKIIWACREQFRELVDNNPYIDDIILVNNVQEFYQNIKPTLDLKENYIIDLTLILEKEYHKKFLKDYI
jgi:ADP-heptose:LPS heptosyltransferase